MTAEEKRKRRAFLARVRYENRKAKGLCPMCGRKPEDGVLCGWCCERVREYTKTPEMREWRSQWEKTDERRKFRREQMRRQRLATRAA